MPVVYKFLYGVFMAKLTKSEKKVLSSLLADGRRPYSKIAKDNKLTRQTVHNVIRRLYSNGIIKRFTTQLDMEKMGLDIKVFSLMSLNKRTGLDQFEKNLRYFKQISQIHRILGPHDYILEINVGSRKELTDFFERMGELPEVEKMESLLVFQTVKNSPNDPVSLLLD